MEKKDHVQQGFNASLGVLRLAKVYSGKRLESACRRALHFGSVSYRCIKAILEQGLDQEPLGTPEQPQAPAVTHENIRGADYYRNQRKEQSNA